MNGYVRCLCRRDRRLSWFAILIALLAANGFFKHAHAAPARAPIRTAGEALVQMDHISVPIVGHSMGGTTR